MTDGDAGQSVDARYPENGSNAFARVAKENALRAHEIGEPQDGSDARGVEERQFREVQDHFVPPIDVRGGGPEEALHLRKVELARQPQGAAGIPSDLQGMGVVLHSVYPSLVWRGDNRPGTRGLPSGPRHTGQERQEIAG